jgi:FKBP-type peptidyl-prolyl cis-trans isomerase (trigger factor)
MAYHNMRNQAERDVRGAMLLDKVAEMEKIDVADSDVDAEIAKLAAYYRSTPDEIRQSLEKQGGGVDSIRNNLKTRKAIEAVVSKAKVTDGEWVEESAGKTEPETETNPKKKKEPAKKAAKKP